VSCRGCEAFVSAMSSLEVDLSEDVVIVVVDVDGDVLWLFDRGGME